MPGKLLVHQECCRCVLVEGAEEEGRHGVQDNCAGVFPSMREASDMCLAVV